MNAVTILTAYLADPNPIGLSKSNSINPSTKSSFYQPVDYFYTLQNNELVFNRGALLVTFESLPKSKMKKIANQIVLELESRSQDSYLSQIRLYAQKAEENKNVKANLTQFPEPVSSYRGLPNAYFFGSGRIMPAELMEDRLVSADSGYLEPKESDANNIPANPMRKLKKIPKVRKWNAFEPITAVRMYSCGLIPGFDLALAEILFELDGFECQRDPKNKGDISYRDYALFFERWGNSYDEDESLFQMLLRFGQQDQEPLLSDLLLDDFAETFFEKKELAEIKKLSRKSRNQQIVSRLFQAYANYRDYRLFCEAVAWSLLLPPEEELPGFLGRHHYDFGQNQTRGKGPFYTRDYVLILLNFNKGSLEKVIQFILDLEQQNPLPLHLDQEKMEESKRLRGLFAHAVTSLVGAEHLLERLQDQKRQMLPLTQSRQSVLIILQQENTAK